MMQIRLHPNNDRAQSCKIVTSVASGSGITVYSPVSTVPTDEPYMPQEYGEKSYHTTASFDVERQQNTNKCCSTGAKVTIGVCAGAAVLVTATAAALYATGVIDVEKDDTSITISGNNGESNFVIGFTNGDIDDLYENGFDDLADQLKRMGGEFVQKFKNWGKEITLEVDKNLGNLINQVNGLPTAVVDNVDNFIESELPKEMVVPRFVVSNDERKFNRPGAIKIELPPNALESFKAYTTEYKTKLTELLTKKIHTIQQQAAYNADLTQTIDSVINMLKRTKDDFDASAQRIRAETISKLEAQRRSIENDARDCAARIHRYTQEFKALAPTMTVKPFQAITDFKGDLQKLPKFTDSAAFTNAEKAILDKVTAAQDRYNNLLRKVDFELKSINKHELLNLRETEMRSKQVDLEVLSADKIQAEAAGWASALWDKIKMRAQESDLNKAVQRVTGVINDLKRAAEQILRDAVNFKNSILDSYPEIYEERD